MNYAHFVLKVANTGAVPLTVCQLFGVVWEILHQKYLPSTYRLEKYLTVREFTALPSCISNNYIAFFNEDTSSGPQLLPSITGFNHKWYTNHTKMTSSNRIHAPLTYCTTKPLLLEDVAATAPLLLLLHAPTCTHWKESTLHTVAAAIAPPNAHTYAHSLVYTRSHAHTQGSCMPNAAYICCYSTYCWLITHSHTLVYQHMCTHACCTSSPTHITHRCVHTYAHSLA